MGNKNYTIKDIARMAGVSAGTVDRVLHNRGDVSAASLEKVRKVLDEISYQPNMFAIGLAAKKRYSIVCIIPYYIAYDYWYAVAGGIDRAAQELAPYNVTVSYLHYLHADEASYSQACMQVLGEECDAVLLAPNFREETLKLRTDTCPVLHRTGLAHEWIHRRQDTDAALQAGAGTGPLPEQSEAESCRDTDAAQAGGIHAIPD